MTLDTRPSLTLRFAGLMALSLTAPLLLSGPASASSQLALDKGCYKCHGNPPKKNAPTFAELTERYARLRNNAGAESALIEKLRQGTFFGHIDAHERLSQKDAQQLIRWIMKGGR